MSYYYNEGAAGTKIRVNYLKPGEVSAKDLKEGKAAKVKLPDGRIIVMGGELLRQAVNSGAVVLQ